MLNLFPERATDCESTRRRFMLQVGSLSGLGLSLEMLLRAEARAASEGHSTCVQIKLTCSRQIIMRRLAGWS